MYDAMAFLIKKITTLTTNVGTPICKAIIPAGVKYPLIFNNSSIAGISCQIILPIAHNIAQNTSSTANKISIFVSSYLNNFFK